MKSTVRSFHLALPANLYEELRAEARRRGRPATAVARQVIEDGLRALRRQELAEEIAEYARENAGTSADFDAELEVAGIESLRTTEE
jgi:predicted DNA-binding protein